MEEKTKNPKFKDLKDKISKPTLSAIKNMGFKHMTDIQAEVLPKALHGDDVVATAKTGSGKTLAFLIPAVESVAKALVESKQGTFCIIISPTRELATQTYTVLQEIISYCESITSSLVIGGESRKAQSAELAKGVHIVVATPGRLFDHMRTKEFDYRNVTCLVLDEADKIFQYGFEEDLKQIISRLPKNRQTMLFSATQSETTEALIKSAMKEDVRAINTNEDNDRATVEGLKQGYVICETKFRLHWLHKLLKKTQNSKIMVFFSSCKSVEFHYEFLSKHCNMPVLCIHGKMNQADRTATINNFYNAKKMALFCTDLAARGLDIPAVDWIVQFDPPSDTNEYIHRVGRTARGLGAEGRAVLLLRPEEKDFVAHLRDARVYLDKYELWDRYSDLSSTMKTAMEDPGFHKLAIEAFEGYIRAFEVKKLKQVFNLLNMDLDAVARSLGLDEKPDVDIRVGFSKKHRPRKRMAAVLANKGTAVPSKLCKT
ncbi:probable ATP-dependent RNA helicase pitchoune [Maniola jurtina]|uniref:probable ATP-dependent RNA helicase pitchoune n=1 Tax=Maniola jurtina TaxID=191418 RepID=UPI001E686B19|nr:probable ATP-dependent RNA helicase pitchoune [Maniola jurtina]XP_045767202.1 probable ATP-dependent RNA helicase pitchoune [Maniola jurtina]